MAAAGALDQALLQAYNTQQLMVAPDCIIECFRAACSSVSFAYGLEVEQKQFAKLLMSPEADALQYAFFAERLTAKVEGVDAQPAPLNKIGIIGAGLMGGGIAMCFAQKGVPVVLKDAKQEWLDAGVKKIFGIWDGQVTKGKLKPDEAQKLKMLIAPTLNYADLRDVDIVIEAVPEIMNLKKEVFRELERSLKKDAIICSNTSGLNIDEMAFVLEDPSRVMGTHFFSPANVMQLLENVRTTRASPRTLATGMAIGKLINKKTVMAGNCDGFIGNRMCAPYGSEAKQLIEDGATIEQIDGVATAFGMAMGPIALSDLVGIELFWKQRKELGDMKSQTKTSLGPYELVDWLCELGRYGQKTPDKSIGADGRGFYIHKGRNKDVDPEVVRKIDEIRKVKGVVARKISDTEVIERLFFPLINEGFKLLEEGYASKPSDIDIVYLFGYGFPPSRGGPMFYAEKSSNCHSYWSALSSTTDKHRTESRKIQRCISTLTISNLRNFWWNV